MPIFRCKKRNADRAISLEPYEGMNAFVEKWAASCRGSERGERVPFWGPYAKQGPQCDANGIPAQFEFCGKCGADLACPWRDRVRRERGRGRGVTVGRAVRDAKGVLSPGPQ